ncbi:hypothetical protein OH492_03250 [Vibrio chagasii]|nr:hypothetical protein [Vibrio chagasii]
MDVDLLDVYFAVVDSPALGFVLFTNPGLNTVLWGAEKLCHNLKWGAQKVLCSRTSHLIMFNLKMIARISIPQWKSWYWLLILAVYSTLSCVDRLAIQGLDFAFYGITSSFCRRN